MKQKNIELCSFTNPNFKISYTEIDSQSTLNTYDSHSHDKCEIYINISGDVSFVVENSIYPIIPGSIIITRPGEYHHCVYHSNALHKHFWILFSSNEMDNLFSRFYERDAGENNLLILSGNRFKELTDLCHSITENNVPNVESLYRFFKLIHLINMAEISETTITHESPCMDLALDFIHKNLSEPILVKDIATAAFVSIATLERHFETNLQMSPSEYLKKRRLVNAANLLQNGTSVTYACQQSGFVDCSKFIILFKKHYGMTPLKYKKENQKNK